MSALSAAPPSSGAAVHPGALISYGLLGMPLAFVALPIYVHLPGLYAEAGLSLASIGSLLLIARAWDAFTDPLIGWWSDRRGARRYAIAAAVPMLIAGYAGLLAPPQGPSASLWLLGMLFLVYLGYSLASVNHHALGAELALDPHQRTRLTAAREGFALAGVLLAAILPGMLSSSLSEGLARLRGVFALGLLAGVMAIWRLQPVARPVSQATGQVFDALRAPAFRSLLQVFAFSGIAAAIPASLVLFFVADVLQAGKYAGLFLGLYFAAGAAGLPFWVWFARQRGKAFAWGAGMLLAVLSFAGAGALGPGDSVPFAIVCLLSGLALGADLALPASMLADLVERERIGAGSCFGWWNFMAKLNLALAAGCALPLLGWLGYVPGAAGQAGHAALAWVYAGVPAFLKLVALGLLWRLARRERES